MPYALRSIWSDPMLLTILIVVLILSIAGGGFSHGKIGYLGWSPLGVVLLAILIFWLTGYIHI